MRGTLSAATLALLLALSVSATAASFVIMQNPPPLPGVPPVIPPVTPPPKDLPEPPAAFTIIDVTATYEWSLETLDDGTKVEFTSMALVTLSRPPQEDVGYRLDLFVKNVDDDGDPTTISLEDFVLTHVTPVFAKAALADVEISDETLDPGETATITIVLYVDAFFYDEEEDVYKLNAHHKALVRDGDDVLNGLGMNVMFRA